MGESPRANMMGQRVFIIALIASFCVALPTTDLVVPEAKDAGTSGAEFVQSTLKSGGTETQCRTFATDTISSINSGVTSEQGTLAAVDTGAGCAQEGQSGVATATTNKANADADVVTKTQAVTDATATQATACNAPVTMVVNLPTLTASTCYGYTQEAQFLSVQAACDAANTALSQANSALGVAQTAATDAQTDLDAAVAEAARLMSECHCRVQQEQAAAWTAAGTATASHAADWKQAHEVLCALDQTSTCTVPTCPAVTQPTLAAGVADEVCSTGPTWVKGVNGANCDDTCSALDKTCDTSYMDALTTADLVTAAFAEAGYTCINVGGSRNYPGSPFSTSRNGDDCYFTTPGSNVVSNGNSYGHHAALCSCVSAPVDTTPTLVDGSVRAENGATATAGVAFVPEVMFNGNWYPICGHFFWDNNHGATTVCQELGYGGFSSGTRQHVRDTYSADSMPVGECSAGQALTSCNQGGNDWGNLEYNGGWCKAGTQIGVTVTCN